jgi:hypothetical protein
MRHALNTAQINRNRARGQARLRSFGIDTASTSREQIRVAYEAQRAAYLNIAQVGLHTTPVDGGASDPTPGAAADARYGMLVDAITDFYGGIFPAAWSTPRPSWPEAARHHTAETTVRVEQLQAGLLTPEEARAELGLPTTPIRAAIAAAPITSPTKPAHGAGNPHTEQPGRPARRWHVPADETADEAVDPEPAFKHWKTR